MEGVTNSSLSSSSWNPFSADKKKDKKDLTQSGVVSEKSKTGSPKERSSRFNQLSEKASVAFSQMLGNEKPEILLTRPLKELASHIKHYQLPPVRLVARAIAVLAMAFFRWHFCDSCLLKQGDTITHSLTGKRLEPKIGDFEANYPYMLANACALKVLKKKEEEKDKKIKEEKETKKDEEVKEIKKDKKIKKDKEEKEVKKGKEEEVKKDKEAKIKSELALVTPDTIIALFKSRHNVIITNKESGNSIYGLFKSPALELLKVELPK